MLNSAENVAGLMMWNLKYVSNLLLFNTVINIMLQLLFHDDVITGFVTRLIRQVPLVEQKLLTLLEQLSSPRGSCYSIFSFMCMFCRSLFVPLCFFFWPLCCLFFFDLRMLITPLESSNSFYPIGIANLNVRCTQLSMGSWLLIYIVLYI